MNAEAFLTQLLLQEHSKLQKNKIVDWVGDDEKRFTALFNVFVNSEYRVIQRAAWPLSDCAIKQPAFLQKHYKKIIEKLNAPNQHPAVKRNILRILEQLPSIPKAYHGRVMQECFNCIENPQEAIAAQAFALGILQKLATAYPDVVPEILVVIQSRMDNAPPAFLSRAKKIIKKYQLHKTYNSNEF